MSKIHTREPQLAILRVKRERDLAAERADVDFAFANCIMPNGADRLFDCAGRYPGRHGIIADLVTNLAAGEHSVPMGFDVIGGALAKKAGESILFREFELILDASDQTSVICCVCAPPRGHQRHSVVRTACDVCAAVDLMMRHDAEAAEARGWHSTV